MLGMYSMILKQSSCQWKQFEGQHLSPQIPGFISCPGIATIWHMHCAMGWILAFAVKQWLLGSFLPWQRLLRVKNPPEQVEVCYDLRHLVGLDALYWIWGTLLDLTYFSGLEVFLTQCILLNLIYFYCLWCIFIGLNVIFFFSLF